MSEVDLEGGLLRILAAAHGQAAAVRDVQRDMGNPAIGESVLAEYLRQGLAWAVEYARWRDAQLQGPPPEPETVLRDYLQGE
jgi:hypothetical protein